MNQPHAIQALREALKQYGGWEQLHRACVLVDGVLVLQKQKAPAVKLVPLSKPKLGGLPCKHDRGKGE